MIVGFPNQDCAPRKPESEAASSSRIIRGIDAPIRNQLLTLRHRFTRMPIRKTTNSLSTEAVTRRRTTSAMAISLSGTNFLADAETDPKGVSEPPGKMVDKRRAEAIEATSRSFVVRRGEGHDEQRTTETDDAPAGRSVRPAGEAEIHHGSADSDAADRDLRQPCGQAGPGNTEDAERREGIDPERRLNRLDQGAGGPRLRTARLRIRDRCGDRPAGVAGQRLRQPPVRRVRGGAQHPLDEAIEMVVESVPLEPDRERRLLDRPD